MRANYPFPVQAEGGAGEGGAADGAPSVEALLDAVVSRMGGATREGQHVMARAVADAMAGDHHLLVQAGTGTGKSLAYLVPAVDHAVRTGEHVVVSTATLALQRQVMTRDLPLVAESLAGSLPRPPQVALLKGWNNYVCRHKVAGGYPADDGATLFTLTEPEPAGAAEHPGTGEGRGDGPGALGAQVLRLREWAEETTTGDRDDLVPGVGERAWRQVSVSAMECLGPRCPMRAECFPHLARETAREADVVVTNHAMLGIAASGSPGVLPEHRVLVVDEAHDLTDRVTTQATVELSASVIEAAARLARRHGGLPTPDLDAAGTALGAVLIGLPEGRFSRGLPGEVRTAVALVRDAARTALSALKPDAAGSSAGEAAAGLKVAAAAMLVLFETAERMAAEDTSRDVLWCARGGPDDRRAGVSRLNAAPLHVSGLIRDELLEGRRVVLTSATLTLGGSFAPLARAVGLGAGGAVGPDGEGKGGEDDDDGAWRGIDVGSPFDYRRQGIVYIARSLPPPTREGAPTAQLDEIAALVEAAGGRTLGLFSSRRAAVAATEAMRERLDVPVLCQGEDQLPTLVRAFLDDERACLFGTLSLWQGVDVPGATCQLVLIDRIPFPRPDDPIRSARAQAVDAAGGNGFMAVSASHAALLLAQGAGRLIRTTTDRGVVAILDPRLATARYGDYLVRSLPPFWRTTDGEVARAALRRLDALARTA